MKIFAGHDGGTGCTLAWWRMTVPLTELARHDGFEVTFADAGDFNPEGRPLITARHLEGYDVICAQRWNTHKGLGIWRQAAARSRLVYEIDDDIWSITPENWNAYRHYGRPDIADAVEHHAATADLVTVTTEPLAQVLREYNPNVAICPNALPRWVTELPPRTVRDRPRVGWSGGASHGVDISYAADPVRRFLKRFSNWDLQLNGSDYRATFKVPDDRVWMAPWVPVYEDTAGFFRAIDYDIAIAPLQTSKFNSSKSGIKAIEAGARGIPTVATDCVAYRAVITHGVDGFLVKREHEWLKYLSELAADTELRLKMGEAARDMARRHVIEDGWTAWADAYAGLFA